MRCIRERWNKRQAYLLVGFVGVDGVVAGEELSRKRELVSDGRDAVDRASDRWWTDHACDVSRPLWPDRHGRGKASVESRRYPCRSVVGWRVLKTAKRHPNRDQRRDVTRRDEVGHVPGERAAQELYGGEVMLRVVSIYVAQPALTLTGRGESQAVNWDESEPTQARRGRGRRRRAHAPAALPRDLPDPALTGRAD